MTFNTALWSISPDVMEQAEALTSELTPERVIVAALLALAATIALPIGAALGVYARPSQKLVAAVMAFGSGALIEALALDLAFEGVAELVRQHKFGPAEAWVYVALGFIIGGLIFFVANLRLEHHGGALRKPSTAEAYVTKNRHRWSSVLHHLHADHLPLLHSHGPQHVQTIEHDALLPAAATEHASSAPTAIFLGALLDGIPESVVIGAGYTTLAAFNPSFLIAVFLNNLPEAMSSAAGMKRGGFTTRRIFSLWIGLMIVSALAAALGNVFLANAPVTVLTFVNAIAGGGILAMLAATMMPEAYEEGGAAVGLSTIAGFLAALYFTSHGLVL